MRVIDAFSLSKTGLERDNEDLLLVAPFPAVIDGVTSKKALPASGKTAGVTAVRLLESALAALDPELPPEAALKFLNRFLKGAAKKRGFADIPAASLIYCNLLRGEVISYGDCSLIKGGKHFCRSKKSDLRLAGIRAQVIKNALSEGKTVDELRENDIGRATIRSELISEQRYANKPNGYPVMDGGVIIPEFIDVYATTPGETIVFASDGYPELCDTLDKSEKALDRLIRRDPLLVGRHPQTKGVLAGNVSFDDRTYLRFEV